jgi:uncharacterized membrane protein
MIRTVLEQIRDNGRWVWFQNAIDRAGRFFSNWPLVTLSLGITASTIIKLIRLNGRELWLDESRSAFFATLPFHDLIRYCIGDTAPPLYHVLALGWVRLNLIRSAEADLRMLSVILSVMGALGMFGLARTWLGTKTSGTFAALLFAFSPILFVYSSEVRQYILLLCCEIAVLIVHHRAAVELKVTLGSLLLYSLVAILLFYSHYIGLFILLGLLLDWLVATRLQARRLAALCFVVVLVFLAASPWIPIMLRQRDLMQSVYSTQEAGVSDPTSLSFGLPVAQPTMREKVGTFTRSVAVVAGFFPAKTPVFMAILAVPLVAALAGIALLMVRGDRTCRMVAWVFLLTGLGLFALGINETRYVLPLIPPLILAISRVVQSWLGNRRWRTAGLIAGSLLLFIYIAGFIRQSSVRYPNPWRGLVATLQPAYREGDIVVFDALYGQVPFDFAAKEIGFKAREDGFPETIYHWWERQPVKVWGGPVLRESGLEVTTKRVVAASATKTVWLVLFEVNYYDPRDQLLARFSELGDATEVFKEAQQASDALPTGKGLRLVRISLRK